MKLRFELGRRARMQAVYRQSYPGPITVVFVEDCSPGASFEKISESLESTFDQKPAGISIQTVRNAENLGNCLSRNAGIAACIADIYVLIDADCLMNGDFVRAHVSEHLLGGGDHYYRFYGFEFGRLAGPGATRHPGRSRRGIGGLHYDF